MLAAFCERIARGEGVECRFFGQERPYLFLGDHKYWTMTDCPDIDLDTDDYVLNRALLYRDRRDFLIQPGDTGIREGDPTMTTPEERIEQLPVRAEWPTEDRHFTPWLADNLDLLGNELGMKLELVKTEVLLGPYSLDIMARDAEEGVIVAIENQLGETDHSHLGQLLTYASGCGAHAAIWVAPDFVYEHAQALHRLNEWTTGRIRFYGVKVEYVKKGDADREPRLLKVVYPGGWNEAITRQSWEMPQIKRQHHEFFQPLIAELLKANFSDRQPVQRFNHTGRHFHSSLNPSVKYAASLEGKNDAWVTLHVEADDKEFTKQMFDELHADREQIERSIDAGSDPEWCWYRHDGYLFSSINVRKDGSIDDSPDKLEETRAWMLDLLPKFKKVFDPRVKEILDQHPAPEPGQ